MTITTRGTSNGNQRGSSYARRSRRRWLILNYGSNYEEFCRCYRCGVLLFNPDDYPEGTTSVWPPATLPVETLPAIPMTVDRIVPGCHGGTYRRNNIRPACGLCNSETGETLVWATLPWSLAECQQTNKRLARRGGVRKK